MGGCLVSGLQAGTSSQSQVNEPWLIPEPLPAFLLTSPQEPRAISLLVVALTRGDPARSPRNHAVWAQTETGPQFLPQGLLPIPRVDFKQAEQQGSMPTPSPQPKAQKARTGNPAAFEEADKLRNGLTPPV